MKILAFSDLHRDQIAARMVVEASHAADVVIGAGDFATKGIGAHETLDILKGCAAPVVLVHGNHDDPDEIRALCEGWGTGHYLHGQSVTIDTQVFFGLGGEVPSRNDHSWNTADTELHAASLLAACPKDAVLITHTPPFGTADQQKDGAHEGSTAILDAAYHQQPKLLLCGHIHNAWGRSGQIGATQVFNLGPTLNWFDA